MSLGPAVREASRAPPGTELRPAPGRPEEPSSGRPDPAGGAASKKSRLLKLGGVVSSRAGGSVLNLVANLLLGRTLGAAGTGVFYLFHSWTNILGTAGSLGLPMYVLRQVSVAAARGTGGRALLLRAVRVVAAVAAAVLLAVLLLRGFLSEWLLQDSGLSFVLLLAALGGGALAVTRVGAEALKAVRSPGTGIALEFIVAPAVLVLYLSLAAVGLAPASSSWAVWAFTGGLLVAGGAGVLLALHRLPPAGGGGTRLERGAVGSFWGISLLNTLMATAPYLVLPWFASVAEIGRFGLAHRLVALSATILAALASYFAPRFAERRATGDGRGLRREFLASCRYSALLFAPFLAVFVLTPEPLLRLFGSEFAAAAPLLVVLAFGRVINSSLGLTEHMLSMTGHEQLELLSATVALGIFVAAAAVFGGAYGVVGVTWSYAGAFALRSAISFALVQRLVLSDGMAARRARVSGPAGGAASSGGGRPERADSGVPTDAYGEVGA